MELNRDSKINARVAADFAAVKGEGGIFLDGFPSNDLARFCLELDPTESKRALAWVTSICAVYLLIGILGLKPRAPDIVMRPLQEEVVPTVIEPLITPVQTVTADASSEEPPGESESDSGPPIIAVVADSAAVAFSVPTVGNMVVPMALSQAPPSHPMQGAVPVSSGRVEQIGVTGIGGSRPSPPYPRESLLNREQGTVVLLLEVDESGKIASVTVKESSGYGRLDQATVDYMKRHWFFPPAKGQRMYEAPIVYQLQ